MRNSHGLITTLIVLMVCAGAHAAGGTVKGPNEIAPDRYVYYPGTEVLAENEIRVIACGTGMPDQRMGQASACFLVELGNGDKFIFDLGTGSMRNIASLMIPYQYLTRIFLSNLNTDHWGDHRSLWAGCCTSGRPLTHEIWGPSGATSELGTAYALDHMQKMLTWDLAGRAGNVDFRGYRMDVTEFDFKGENQVVYEENGVTIRSFPAIHSIDGSVSYSLEWNGLKFVFSSDTYPNTWFNKYARDADLVVHECFIAVPELVSKMGFTPESALLVGTQVHTAPEAFGKVMSEIKPRMAVAYHFFKDYDTTPAVYDRIRKTYDGPLSLAEDYMVWNVTKDDIRVRLAEVDHHTWAPPAAAPAEPPKPEDKTAMARKLGVDTIDFSEFTKSGFWNVDDVLRPIYEEASEVLGQEFPYPEKQ